MFGFLNKLKDKYIEAVGDRFLTPEYVKNMSWDDIIEMEKQGTDVSKLKEMYLEIQAKEEAADNLRFTMEKIDESLIHNKTNITKLESLIDDLRNPDSEIIRDTVGKPPMMGKDKWREDIKNSDLLYASVVQCHPQLWEKIISDITPAAYVFVYSQNPEYMRDIETLKKVSLLLNEFRDMDENEVKEEYSKKMFKLYKDLNDPQSSIHTILDNTLLEEIGITEDTDIRAATNFIYDDTPLKNECLPSDGMLPFLRFKEKGFGEDANFAYATRLIPSKYYE